MIELLSPAGSRASLEAAVQSGADAVYMGFGAFNARRNGKKSAFARTVFSRDSDSFALSNAERNRAENPLFFFRKPCSVRFCYVFKH